MGWPGSVGFSNLALRRQEVIRRLHRLRRWIRVPHDPPSPQESREREVNCLSP
jgi:hypothetical protein